MGRCRRIRNIICENRRNIIIDTNALIHYTQYLSETKYSNTEYHDIFRDFRTLFNIIIMQCSYRNLIASEIVLREEYQKTFITEVRFLNELDTYYQTRFTNVITDNLQTRMIDRNVLAALRPIADDFSRRRRSAHIDNRDLSLLLAALEELKDHPGWNFLIITGDDSFRRFIPYIKRLNQITLAGTTYMTSNINGTILLTLLTHLFTCCQFNEIFELRKDIFIRETKGRGDNVIRRKTNIYNKWYDKVYLPAVVKKRNYGVCV